MNIETVLTVIGTLAVVALLGALGYLVWRAARFPKQIALLHKHIAILYDRDRMVMAKLKETTDYFYSYGKMPPPVIEEKDLVEEVVIPPEPQGRPFRKPSSEELPPYDSEIDTPLPEDGMPSEEEILSAQATVRNKLRQETSNYVGY